MSFEPTSSRAYDEQDVGTILRRASELQGQGVDGPSFGLTSAELSRVAEEAGIDPRYVAAALSELDLHAAEAPSSLWGGPLELTLDRVIPADVSDETWEAMIAVIRRTFRDPGHVTQRGASREWAGGAKGGSQKAYVTAVPCEGGTHLHVSWADPVMAVPLYVFAGVVGLILIPVVFESLGMVSFTGLGLYLGLLGVLLALARWGVTRMARTKVQEVRRLTETLEHLVGDVISHSELGRTVEGVPVQEGHSPLLDLSGIDPEERSHPSREIKPTRQRL